MRASVIIPAHNEEKVLSRLLSALTVEPGEFEIIVVCNGCTDSTADVARTFEPHVHVIDSPQGGKTNALNLGDAAATTFPRLYIDADVLIDRTSVHHIIETLEKPGVLAASPTPQLAVEHASSAVRRFYEVDAIMPTHVGGIGGSGVYAMNEQGRARFGEFPPIIADDAFVRRHFAEGERVVAEGAISHVVPPCNIEGLTKIKTRSHLGNHEINQKFPELSGKKGRGNRVALLRLAKNPTWWPSLATYVYVKSLARLRARHQAAQPKAQGEAPTWERDDTSRLATLTTATSS